MQSRWICFAIIAASSIRFVAASNATEAGSEKQGVSAAEPGIGHAFGRLSSSDNMFHDSARRGTFGGTMGNAMGAPLKGLSSATKASTQGISKAMGQVSKSVTGMAGQLGKIGKVISAVQKYFNMLKNLLGGKWLYVLLAALVLCCCCPCIASCLPELCSCCCSCCCEAGGCAIKSLKCCCGDPCKVLCKVCKCCKCGLFYKKRPEHWKDNGHRWVGSKHHHHHGMHNHDTHGKGQNGAASKSNCWKSWWDGEASSGEDEHGAWVSSNDNAADSVDIEIIINGKHSMAAPSYVQAPASMGAPGSASTNLSPNSWFD